MLSMKIKNIITIIVFVLLLLNGSLHAQIKVRGVVYDNVTYKPVPFANIALNDKRSGTVSTPDGRFFLEEHSEADSLYVSYLGYKTKRLQLKKKSYNELTIFLEPENLEIREVKVTPGKNRAHEILKKIIHNKEKNRLDYLSSYQCEVYNKLELDYNNIDEKLKNRKALKPFRFVFDNIDTSALTGKAYLPMYITETVSDYYYQAPNTGREVIKASKVAGLEDPVFSQYTGIAFQKVDIYENFMEVITRGFVSPVSDVGRLYYKYYVIDSIVNNGSVIYNIGYKPKRDGEKTFSGYFKVEKGTYAITSIKMTLNQKVNINYINNLTIQINYQKINDSIWFISDENYEVECNLRDDGKGFVGKKSTQYSNVVINTPIPKDVQKMRTRTRVHQNSGRHTSGYWENIRPRPLSRKEMNIYSTIDSIKEVPVFKTAVNWINMFACYYYDLGWFEYGPYYKTISYNEIEGYRLRFGGRTSSEISKKHRFAGYIAYGFKDERYKYEMSYINYIERYPWTTAGLRIAHDIKQLGQSENAFSEDNFMTTFLRRQPNYKLTLVNGYEAFFEKEWFEGLSNKITFVNREIRPTQYIPFNYYDNGELNQYGRIITSELTLDTRFALHEQFFYGTFERTSLSTKMPVFTLRLSAGIPGLFGGGYRYYKTRLTIEDKIDISPFGKLLYIAEGGKIFGKLPYPLLELHKGNETYAYDRYALNRMGYYEFVSDEYIKVLVEQHFMGFFFNKIPFLKRLNLREVLYGQAVYGRLRYNHEEVMLFPEGLSSLNGPYIEAGIGIENILRLIRIDGVWRLTHTQTPQDVILMLSLKLDM